MRKQRLDSAVIANALNALVTMSEIELQQEIVIPLLRAVGYRDVRAPAGPSEKGKDLLACRQDEFGRITLHAVQIKKQRLHAAVQKPGSLIRVLDQLRQATRELVFDPNTNTRRRPDGCLFVTPFEVPIRVFEAFEELLREERLENVRLLDGVALLEALREKAPEILRRLGVETKYRVDLSADLARVGEASIAFGVKRDISLDAIFVGVPLQTDISVPLVDISTNERREIPFADIDRFLNEGVALEVFDSRVASVIRQSAHRQSANDTDAPVEFTARQLLGPLVSGSEHALQRVDALAESHPGNTIGSAENSLNWLLAYSGRSDQFLETEAFRRVSARWVGGVAIRRRMITIAVDHLLHLGRDLLVIGPPGGGKTTVLRRLCREAATIDAAVPVFVKLAEVERPTLGRLKMAIAAKTKALREWRGPNVAGGRPTTLFLDGLDESASAATTMARAVARLQERAHRPTSFVVSCRDTAGVRQLGDALTLAVVPFSPEQLDLFIGRWFQEDVVSKQLVRKWLRRHEAVKRVASIPLMAALLCALAEVNGEELPTTEAELYEGRFELLLGRWERAKGLPTMRTAVRRRYLHFLTRLALRTHVSERPSFDKDGLLTLAQEYGGTGEIMVQDCLERGLLFSESDGTFSLGHLTFQEFLAARRLRDTNPVRFIVWALKQRWWGNVLRYYAVMTGDLSSVVAELLRHRLDAGARSTLEHLCLSAPLTRPQLLESLQKKKLVIDDVPFPWKAAPGEYLVGFQL